VGGGNNSGMGEVTKWGLEKREVRRGEIEYSAFEEEETNGTERRTKEGEKKRPRPGRKRNDSDGGWAEGLTDRTSR